MFIYVYIICDYVSTGFVLHANKACFLKELTYRSILDFAFFSPQRGRLVERWTLLLWICFGYILDNSLYSILSCLWMSIDAYGKLEWCAEVHEKRWSAKMFSCKKWSHHQQNYVTKLQSGWWFQPFWKHFFSWVFPHIWNKTCSKPLTSN